MGLIEFLDVTKSYGKRLVFQNVNLEIDAGAFVVLRGDSGAGKSTLLDLIGGLETPTSGKILVEGKDVSTLKPKEKVAFYRHMVGIIFQGAYLQPQFSLLENISLPGIFAGMPPKQRLERAQRLAQELGIEDILNFRPAEVSGGQAARTCIARALMLEPSIILADEPTSNLDEANANAVLKLLDDIRRKFGVTVVVASHDQNVSNFATQVVTIKDGTVTTTKNKAAKNPSEAMAVDAR